MYTHKTKNLSCISSFFFNPIRHMALWTAILVHWSRLKCLNSWMDHHKIKFSHSWSLEADPPTHPLEPPCLNHYCVDYHDVWCTHSPHDESQWVAMPCSFHLPHCQKKEKAFIQHLNIQRSTWGNFSCTLSLVCELTNSTVYSSVCWIVYIRM